MRPAPGIEPKKFGLDINIRKTIIQQFYLKRVYRAYIVVTLTTIAYIYDKKS